MKSWENDILKEGTTTNYNILLGLNSLIAWTIYWSSDIKWQTLPMRICNLKNTELRCHKNAITPSLSKGKGRSDGFYTFHTLNKKLEKRV